jgi:hypothetical protein
VFDCVPLLFKDNPCRSQNSVCDADEFIPIGRSFLTFNCGSNIPVVLNSTTIRPGLFRHQGGDAPRRPLAAFYCAINGLIGKKVRPARRGLEADLRLKDSDPIGRIQ